MKIIFYSEKCINCNNIISYIDKNNLRLMFSFINIDIIEQPKEIDCIPTIIDTDISQPIKGKKILDYLMNIKYFNNPTNNIDFIKDLPDNPVIPNDDKAYQSNTHNLEINKGLNDKIENEIPIVKNNISNKKLSTLLKLTKKNKN